MIWKKFQKNHSWLNDKILLVLPIQLSSVSHKMVVKELKHFSCNTEFGNRLAHPRLFPFEVLQVIKSFRPKKGKTTDRHRRVFRIFRKYRFAKGGPRDRFFLVIPFQANRFSFCASKFENVICWFLIQQFQTDANQQLRVAFMVSHCFWRLRLYSCFEV